MTNELIVNTILTFSNDSQRIVIFDHDAYNPDEALFFGEAQDLPLKYYTLHVSKIYTDYVYSLDYVGSILGIRLAN